MTAHVNTAAQALAMAKADKIRLGAAGHCLEAVRDLYGLDANNHEPSAYAAWVYEGGHDGPNTHTVLKPPAGVPVFWSGGSRGYGHVAISDGLGAVYSTDVKRDGRFDRVPLAWVHTHWGLTYLGWTETLEGKRIYPHVSA